MSDLCLVKRESVSAGVSGKVELMVLPKNRLYTVKRVEVHIDSSSDGSFEIALYAGSTKISPDNGFFTSELNKSISVAEKQLPEGAVLYVYRNNPTSGALKYAIVVDLAETS